VQDSGHPDDEHSYLWFLAVDPAHRGAGLGPDDAPYYASNGFEGIGRGTLPRDTPMWFMRRP
jgi:hypothetical protein